MGVSYDQYCIVGVCIGRDQIKIIDNEAIYEDQPVYDTKTGKKVSTRKVLVKEEESHYELLGISKGDLDSLGDAIAKKCRFSYIVDYDSDILYLGYKIGDSEDRGRTSLLQGTIEVDQIVEYQKFMQDIFPDHEISLCFCNHVG